MLIFPHEYTYSSRCHDTSIIARTLAAFAEPTAETAVVEVSNLNVI